MTGRAGVFVRHNSFLRGVARVVDIAGSIDRDALKRNIHSKSSADAIRDDWKKVGNDIKKAISEFTDETTSTSK